MTVSTTLHRRRLLAGLGLSGLALTGIIPHGAAQHSPFATPTVAEATGSALDGPLGTLLAMVPLSLVESQTQGSFWTYSDIARQFESLGMTHSIDGPDTENEPFVDATYALAAMGNLFTFAMDEELAAAIGFRVLGLDQMLYIGNPPNQVQLFRAPFDAEQLVAAWQESGYEERVSDTGVSIWTIGPDREISPDHPIQRKALSEMNNLALVGDVIVASPALEHVEQVLTHIASDGASLLDEPLTGPAIATLPETIVSAMAIPASALGISPFEIEAVDAQTDEIEAIRAEFGQMPPIQGLIAAVNEGAIIADSDWSPDGTPVATPRSDIGAAFWRMNAATPEDAEQIRAIVEARWNRLRSLATGLPYTDYMGITATRVVDSVAEIDFQMLTNPTFWLRLIYQRDVLPLAPDNTST